MGVPESVECHSLPLGKQLLRDLPQDPGFWLQYADHCRARDDFDEALIALDEAGRLLEEQREACGDQAPMIPVLDSLQWRKDRILAEALKVLARGNPAHQVDLVQALQRLSRLSYESICRRLEEALDPPSDVLVSDQGPGAMWNRHLARMKLAIRQSVRRDPDYRFDLRVIQDLATALMGSGQFEEAAQLFTEAPYTSFVADDETSERELRWYPTLIQWVRTFLEDPFKQVTRFASPGHRYVIGMVVWGDAFLDALEQFSLSSLLAKGNLPHLAGSGEVHALFFTTEAGARRLEGMPAMKAIRELITVDIVTFPDELAHTRDTYKLMSSTHLAAMAVAKASHAHFLFLAPDIVLADNFLQVIDASMRRGVEVVFVPGVMLQMESFAVEQAQRFPSVQGVLSISPTNLLDLGIRHIHPFAKEAYTYSPVKRRPSASLLMWPLGKEAGYLIHGFHHTPYLVSAEAMQRFDNSLFFTIDGEFLLKIIRTKEHLDRCVLLTDLEETNYFELSRGSRFDLPLEFDTARICRWGSMQGIVAKWLFPQSVCMGRAAWAANDLEPTHRQVVADILLGMRSE